ncbi:MAG TPA: methylmalonyl Co-A mutase-associated GTPase MeaB [Alphaproteobacteria bacterium]|nr:methylmalonyl Co-A mutase-associated GTPase MeaB [Alphaproteobacteria bacterium]
MTPLAGNDRRALSRMLSRAANASVAEVLGMSGGSAASSRRIGVTGPPGVGKSSLIARLAQSRLSRPGELAIIAIDPTSPKSGGAILGDRVRMQELADEPRVFIRSLASRVSQDGLSDNLPDILAVLENAGFAELIIETVGVGQVGYAVKRVVDTNVLVSMPGTGDQIQAMKGGLLEMADICVVNKADLPGARQLASELESVVAPRGSPRRDWTPPVILISAAEQEGIDQLGDAIDRHQAWLAAKGRRDVTLIERRVQHVGSLVARRTAEIIDALPHDVLLQPLSAAYAAVVSELARPCAPIQPAGDRTAKTMRQP